MNCDHSASLPSGAGTGEKTAEALHGPAGACVHGGPELGYTLAAVPTAPGLIRSVEVFSV